MFNGLIREIASVKSFKNTKLSIKASYKPQIGDSIAINGACLSVVELFDGGFSVEFSHESLKCLVLENYQDKVHIEPAMRLNERIEGHLMQGHIDAIGKLVKINSFKDSKDFYISVDKDFLPLLSYKGSVGVEGVSLTISEVLDYGFKLSLIPISLKHTLFSEYKVGKRLNLESDLLARYIKRQLEFKNSSKNQGFNESLAYLY